MIALKTWMQNNTQSLSRTALGIYFMSIGMPFTSDFPVIILGLAALSSSWLEKDNCSPYQDSLIPFAAFITSTLVSIFFAINTNRAILTNLVWLPGLLILYLTNRSYNPLALDKYLKCCGVLSILIGSLICVEFLQQPNSNPTNWIKQAGLPYLTVPNDLLLLAITAPCSCALISLSQTRMGKAFGAFALIFSLITILITRSNAALLVYFFSLTVFLSLHQSKQIIYRLGSFFLLSIIITSLTDSSVFREFFQNSTWTSRIPLWSAAWSMFVDAPIIGHGPGTFSLIYETYLDGMKLPAWVTVDQRHAPWAHNLYLELLAERGFFGMVTFLVFLFFPIHQFLTVEKNPNIRENIFQHAMLACISGMLIAGLFELSILRYWVVVLLCFFIGLLKK